ncbi:hypothetical protein CBR_g31848 [Chara braunii]|uniref:Myb-like domain-containing protein n=1 Tax=Chara braunii TaxID=69332 RepID=A0A388LG61_CHABU|nr:hypothetical protein CBR_g31848 [Chara braunii]|eukprot:GBG81172.1 hypothetical protein CBR_g31848 [Chara braunii]
MSRVATALRSGLPPLPNFKYLHTSIYSPGKESHTMTSLLAEGESFGPPLPGGLGRLNAGVQSAYPARGMAREGGYVHDGHGTGASVERPHTTPPTLSTYSMSAGGGGCPFAIFRTSASASELHVRERGGGVHSPSFAQAPAISMSGGGGDGVHLPSFAPAPANITHVRPQFMYSSDNRLYRAFAPLAGAAISATTGDVQTGSHCHDYDDGGDPIIDAGMGDAFAEPTVDITGTQGGGRATLHIDDDEGATQSDDVVPWSDRVKRSARAEGGGRGGQDKGKARVRGPDWTKKESMGLVRMLFEEDCVQQSRRGRQKIRGRREKYDWLIGKMVEQGFPKRTMEDCESKFYGLLDKGKKIRDYTDKSGKPSYSDMSRSEKKEAGLPLAYEKKMFDALQLKLGKAHGSCEGMMHNVNLQGGQTSTVTDDDETGGGNESGGSQRKADSDSADEAKFRRTGRGSSHNRRSAPESSSDASRKGSFADIERALVEANDHHADKIAGSFVQAMDGMNKTMAEGFLKGSVHASWRHVVFSAARVGEVVDMTGDFALTHRCLIEQLEAHELARKRGVLFARVSSMVDKLQQL